MLWLEILLLVRHHRLQRQTRRHRRRYGRRCRHDRRNCRFRAKTGFIPVDVMLIIMTVILAISVMQRRRACVHGEMRRETSAEQSEIHQRTCTSCLLHADDFRRDGLHGNERFKSVIQEVAKENNVRPAQP